ncbi:MAG: hypothetical protein LBF86_04590 [Helicobacteraceae bacterium]|jgi:hypothetical protein|nr:hypothetical protein [Helicobacteraceae bacterium]
MLRFIKTDVFFRDGVSPQNPFLGSTLRGAFGAALKRIACVNPKYLCEDSSGEASCKCAANCLYDEFFIRKNVYHAYRFSKPIGENSYDFSFYLFEKACEKLPYILSALKEMASACGFGREREKPEIKKIVCNDRVVYENGVFDLGVVEPKSFEAPKPSEKIALHFKTPLRIKSNNKLLVSKPALRQILGYNMTRF